MRGRGRTVSFFSAARTMPSDARMPIAVPACEIASIAYSTWYKRPSGEKVVVRLSYLRDMTWVAAADRGQRCGAADDTRQKTRLRGQEGGLAEQKQWWERTRARAALTRTIGLGTRAERSPSLPSVTAPWFHEASTIRKLSASGRPHAVPSGRRLHQLQSLVRCAPAITWAGGGGAVVGVRVPLCSLAYIVSFKNRKEIQ